MGTVLVGSWVHCIRVELLGHGHEGVQLGDVGEVGYIQGTKRQDYRHHKQPIHKRKSAVEGLIVRQGLWKTLNT